MRELSEVALPRAVRRTRLYTELVENTLRFLIENVGQVEGTYPPQGKLADNFAMRRFAGNGIELVGLLTFSASPVRVLAALADLSGAGRQLIREIAQSLKNEGLLAPGAEYETIDQLLDGLEGAAGRLATTANTPPLDVASLRREWSYLRREATKMPGLRMPSIDAIRRSWEDLKGTAATQGRPVFQVSTLMAIAAEAAFRRTCSGFRDASKVPRGEPAQLAAGALLEHYSATLAEIRETGFVAYWTREFRPYLKAAAAQFSPKRVTLTERALASNVENSRPVSDGAVSMLHHNPPMSPRFHISARSAVVLYSY